MASFCLDWLKSGDISLFCPPTAFSSLPCAIWKCFLFLLCASLSVSDPALRVNIYWTLNLALLQKAQDSATWLGKEENGTFCCLVILVADFHGHLTLIVFFPVMFMFFFFFLTSAVRCLYPFGSVTLSIKLNYISHTALILPFLMFCFIHLLLLKALFISLRIPHLV